MNTRRLLIFLYAFVLLIAASNRAHAATPPVPVPLSPAAGGSVLAPFPLSWSAVSDRTGIVAYNWEISTSSAFTSVILQNSTNGQTQDTVSGLASGVYYWRVQSVNGGFVQSAWSQPRSFNITGAAPGSLPSPSLSPTKGYSTFHPREVITFNWSAVPGAASYILEFATDPSFPVLTRGQFGNILNPTFSFGTGDAEGFYYARVFAVDANGIASAPSNMITYSIFYNNPLPAAPSVVLPGKAATLTLPITFSWTSVPNPQPSGYELQIAKDSSFSTIEEDAPQLNDPSRTVLSLTPGTKFWRVRSIQGDSSLSKPALTAWSAAGTFTVNPAPSAPVSLTLADPQLYSGDSTLVAVQLTSAVPASGEAIALTSSNPAAAPVPATITMPGNIAWTQFMLTTGQVTTPTPVTLTATLSSGSVSVQFTVMPPSLNSVLIAPGSISGGAQPEMIVLLNGVAPAGGAAVNFASDSAAAMPPAVATVAAGNGSVSVPLPTNAVSANTIATITATWNGASVNSKFTITPPLQPAALLLNPSFTTGSAGSFATVNVASVPTSDATFTVTSSNPALASVPNSVVIPAGGTATGFSIFTAPVTVQTVVTISVTGGGITRSANLTLGAVAPAPAQASLTVTATGRSGQSITSSPVGVNVPVGSTGTSSFAAGKAVTLSVTNGRDAIWSGACSSGGNKAKTCTFTVSGNASVTANVQ